MGIKVNVGACRKAGLPGYGSVGSSLNLEIELDNALLDDPTRLRARIAEVQQLCNLLVEEDLDRQSRKEVQAPPAPSPSAAVQAPAPPPPPMPPPAPGPAPAPAPPPPRNGRVLYGWLKDTGQEVGLNLLGHVVEWAKLNQIEGKVTDWPREIAEAAYREASKWADERRRANPARRAVAS